MLGSRWAVLQVNELAGKGGAPVGQSRCPHMPRLLDDPEARHQFHDGKLVVFKRLGSPYWQARIYIAGARKYLNRSLKVTDLTEAVRAAEKIFRRTEFQIDEGLPVLEMRVAKAAELYLTECEKLLSHGVGSSSVHVKNRKNVRNYIKPYFGDRGFSSIGNFEENEYFKWRIVNSKLGGGRPAKSTLHGEISLINAVIEWAESKRHIKRGAVPKLSMPKEMRNVSHGKRAFFEEKEITYILDKLNDWHLMASTPKEKRARNALLYLVPIMYYSGMRTNDIELLRWRDVRMYDHDGTKHVELFLRGKESSKVHAAWVVAQPECHKYLVWWKLQISPVGGEPNPDDHVFWHEAREFPLYEQAFRNFLKKHDIWLDADGKPRSLYSLRHAHAIDRLKAGVNAFVLAENMRTSVQAIRDHYGQVKNRVNTAEITKTQSRRE